MHARSERGSSKRVTGSMLPLCCVYTVAALGAGSLVSLNGCSVALHSCAGSQAVKASQRGGCKSCLPVSGDFLGLSRLNKPSEGDSRSRPGDPERRTATGSDPRPNAVRSLDREREPVHSARAPVQTDLISALGGVASAGPNLPTFLVSYLGAAEI
ncbi:unnamed protein product [Lota lota]